MSADTRRPFERLDVAWGTSDAMSDAEATLWRAQRDPRRRADGVVVEVLDAAPEFDRFRAGLEWAVRRMPRLRQRVVDDPLRVGPPAWVGVGVDLSYHGRRTRLPAGAGFGQVLSIAAALHMAAFDPARPLWEAVLVEGLPDGKAALLLKLHRAYADGGAVVQLLDLLHSDRAEPTPDKPNLPPAAPEAFGPADVLARNVGRTLRGGARATLRSPATVLDQARHPGALADTSAALTRTLTRAARPPAVARSPLLSGRGLSRRLWTVDVPFDALAAAGRAGGGTVTDALIAALAGALGTYHAEHGVLVPELTARVPAGGAGGGEPRPSGRGTGARGQESRAGDRGAGAPSGGDGGESQANGRGAGAPSGGDGGESRAGGRRAGAPGAGAPSSVRAEPSPPVRMALPCSEPDPTRRVALVAGRRAGARRRAGLDVRALAAPLTSRAPGPLRARLTASLTSPVDVQIASFRGLTRPSYVAGSRVERMFPFAAAGGCAITATLVSHEEHACLGVTLDAAAVTDVAGFGAALEASVAALLA